MNINKLLNINFLFLFIVILLALIGTAALYSAGDGSLNPWAKKHLIRFFICFLMLLFVSSLKIQTIYKYSYNIYIASLFLLLLVEIIGQFSKGAERWINIFGVSFQPSELIKVSIILALSKFYHDLRADNIIYIRNLFIPILIILFPFFFVIIQPDLGTALTILLLGILIMFIAGVRLWKFLVGAIITLFSMPIIWSYIKPYQKKRILSFLNPESDPLGQGYQLIQSKIALGSGALTGKGFLDGTQSYLEYLPEKQTDFIFTLVGEEFGFIGAIFIIFLFFILISISFYVSIKTTYVYGRILSLGVSINLFLYVMFNTAMVTGLMPVVGIPLPLLSYGGTVMLSIMFSFGLLLNVDLNFNLKRLES